MLDFNNLPAGESRGERLEDKEWFIAARHRAAVLGNALIATGLLCAVLNFFGLMIASYMITKDRDRQEPPPNMTPEDKRQWEAGRDSAPGGRIICTGLVSVIYLPLILGGWNLQRGTGRELGIGAALIALLPCGPGFVISLPVGIWALFVLNDANVIAALHVGPSERR